MLPTEILDYYRRGGERHRLDRGAGRLEYLRTRDVLRRALPAAPARLLDIGGGTGVYAGPLAAAGYRVTVVDPVPDHVAAAAGHPGVTAVAGDARRVPLADGSADAVLLLGPLYHLIDAADRLAAWREAGRLLRPGGVVVAATISRFASLHDGWAHGHADAPGFADLVAGALADGRHRPPPGADWFTTAYFHHPTEPAAEATAAGLADARTVFCEGPLWLLLDGLDPILADPARAAALLDQLRRVEDEPSLLGASAHLLTLARRPGPGR
ncbi:hypothetical protein GCM10010123_43130 [Pilimelia anulata]|uniref:Methyltransferase type 11 domain-containing protein n=1 Tax=Pilimelia anulata TaxID=53371 RepID=A0A8J3FEJ5_9ACTN|nr:class I SAM-dependent methyltransferase [Pilimelia anulata]GGK08620.1 hypothetical protein GCM10010123_43130 [Pilimelia anulata]